MVLMLHVLLLPPWEKVGMGVILNRKGKAGMGVELINREVSEWGKTNKLAPHLAQMGAGKWMLTSFLLNPG
jgi:hypothetical protein